MKTYPFPNSTVQSVLEKVRIGLWEVHFDARSIVFDETALSIVPLDANQGALPLEVLLHFLQSENAAVFEHFLQELQEQAQARCELMYAIHSSRRFLRFRGFLQEDGSAAGTVEDITVHTAKEKIAQGLNGQLNALQSFIKLGWWELTLENQQLYWSDEIFHSFGLNPRQAPSPSLEQFHRLIHPDDSEALQKIRQEIQQTGQPCEVEIRQKQADGTYRWTLVRGRPVFDEYANVKGILGINLDIHERKQQERILQRFRKVLDQTSEAIFIIDAGTNRFIDVNESACRSLGYDRSELLEMHIGNICSDNIATTLQNIARTQARPGSPLLITAAHRRKDGSTFPVEVSVSYEEFEHSPCIIGIARDITERIQTQERLRESESKLEVMFENTTDAIWSVDSRFRITSFNSAFTRYLQHFFGIAPALGLHLPEAFGAMGRHDIAHSFESRYQRALRGESFLEIDEFEIPAWGKIYLEVKFNPIVVQHRTVGVSVFARDITQARTAEIETQNLKDLLQTVLDASLSAIATLRTIRDEDGKIVDFEWILANKKAAEIAGVTPGDLVGKRLLQLLPGQRDSGFFDIYQTVVETGATIRREHYYGYDGFNLWLEIIAVRLNDGLSITFYDITERKHSEKALKAQQALVDAIVRNIPLDFWARDLDGQLTWQNDVSIQNWGYLIGTNQFSSPETDLDQALIAQWTENNRRAMDGQVINQESTYRIHGQQRVYQEVIAPIWEDNRVRGILGINIDITDLKRTQEKLHRALDEQIRLYLQLQEKESQLSEAQKMAGLGSWEWDIAHNTGSFSENFYALYGISPNSGEIHLNTFLQCVHPEDMHLLEISTQRVIEKKAPFEFEFRIIRPSDFSERIIHSLIRVTVDSNNNATRMFGISQDITERKRTENKVSELLRETQQMNQALKASEEQLLRNLEIQAALLSEIQQKEANLSGLINNTYDIILSVDRELRLVEFNKSFSLSVINEYSFSPQKGQSITAFNRNHFFEKLHPSIEKALNGRRSLEQIEYISISGRKTIYEISYNPIAAQKKQVLGVSMVIRDITELKKAELALRENELRFRLISEVTTDAMWEWNVDETRIHWLTGHSKISQFMDLDQHGTTGFWNASVHPQDQQRVLKKIQTMLVAPGVQAYEDEYRVYKRDGSLAYVMEKCKIIRDRYGKALRVLGGLQEITQIRLQQNTILQALEKEKKLNEQLAIREEELRRLNEQLTMNYRHLEEKELTLRRAQRIAQLGSWECDLLEKTIFWSDEMYQIHDVPDGFVPQFDAIAELFGPEQARVMTDAFQELITNRTELDLVFRCTTPQQVKWFRTVAYPLLENDQIVKVMGITHDITNYKRIEEKLRSSEEKFSKAFDMSPDIITLIREKDMAFFECNKTTEEITGYSRGELVGRNALEIKIFRHPEDQLLFFNQYWTRGQAEVEVPICRKDGTYFDAALTVRQIEIEGETYMLNVTRDITEKKMAARQLKDSETNLNAIINNTDLSIWSIDRNYRIITLNNAFRRRMRRLNIHFEVGSHALGEQVSQALRDRWKPLYDRALQGEKYRLEDNYDGGSYYEYSFNPILTDWGVSGVAIYSRNITDRKLKEQQIERNALELAEMHKKMGELKLMALRSFMNPHFIFNSLNSIQYFVAKNEKENAINYLSYFSKLIRGVLNSSVKNKISLADELELLKYYIRLELVRFDNKFDVVYDIDSELDLENIEIPSLLVQPFVENAILHGLYNKTGRGTLKIAVHELGDTLLFEVEDDGIGRKAAAEIRERTLGGHKSMGMVLTKERLEIINQETAISVDVIDLEEDNEAKGTLVKIFLKF